MDRGLRAHVDVIGCAVLALGAGIAYLALPSGSAVRMALALPVLFFAPGYLLVEAAAGPARTAAAHALRALVAIGVSPGLVGLLSLATALMPGGFRPGAIALCLVLSTLAFAGAAGWRRHSTVAQARKAALSA